MIRQGGYAVGKSYTYYRDHGHNPVAAVWMALPLWAILPISMLVGWVVADIAIRLLR